MMDVLHSIDVAGWSGPFAADTQEGACDALESGRLLFFPHLEFRLAEHERLLLTPDVSDGKSKNVSLKGSGELGGTSCTGEQASLLQQMMERFARDAARLVEALIPAYANRLARAPTSYRPVEIAGRSASAIHDDTRLHIDAFPSRPMRGKRILRLFSNIHPGGAPRVWHVGEPFEAMARRFLPAAREGSPAQAWMMNLLGVTKGRRSAYDWLMLGLHDGAKLDAEYQQRCAQTEIGFRAGSTWICFTDQVMHAALAGQYVLEQTFHIEVDAMVAPDRAPLRVLERLRGHALV
ncbi:MAG TPA: Kdo hydroxylase family protein [Rhizomicrobium sp.]|jgi:hypothetical protein|nr:Kdo hydroxylase family protein [Rhizomicrobium sp.]